ncbi:MAG: hypothetical protein FWB98_00700 [Defluviitaleaceae bacterium]|nr:hypothetical protein [Defluviitaleaceae bacterium]
MTLLAFGLASCDDPEITTPNLYITHQNQAITAIQGVTNWWQGNSGVSFDSPHSLQLSEEDLGGATLFLEGMCSEISLRFSRQPSYIQVLRWNVDDLGNTDTPPEAFAVQSGIITVADSHYGWIWQVNAIWEQGDSNYTFRTIRY